MHNANFRSYQKHTDQVEMEIFFGVVLAMAVSPATCIDDYWSTEDNDFMPALKFKAHISRYAACMECWLHQ